MTVPEELFFERTDTPRRGSEARFGTRGTGSAASAGPRHVAGCHSNSELFFCRSELLLWTSPFFLRVRSCGRFLHLSWFSLCPHSLFPFRAFQFFSLADSPQCALFYAPLCRCGAGQRESSPEVSGLRFTITFFSGLAFAGTHRLDIIFKYDWHLHIPRNFRFSFVDSFVQLSNSQLGIFFAIQRFHPKGTGPLSTAASGS